MDKRAEKSLQMIFAIFILVIVTLVVLAMFFRFIGLGSTTLSKELNRWTKEAAKQDAMQSCETLCDSIEGENDFINFCQQQFAVDWNEDGLVGGVGNYGKWWFCEKRIPCFVLVDDCKTTVDGHTCRDTLAEMRKDVYNSYYVNTESKEDPLANDFGDGCGLPTSTSSPDTDGHYATDFNWKERFCFTEPLSVVLGPGYKCNNV